MPAIKIPEAVKRVFTESFTARDVAEPLASFDTEVAAGAVGEFMHARDFDVVGIRREGRVVGYVERSVLEGGHCGQHLRPFSTASVVSDTAPLLTVLTALDRAPFLFIEILGCVGGIITPADLQKPPVRMWLFGILTLIEMRCSELIEQHCPQDNWQQYVSEARLRKAEALLEERRRRNQALRLFDCLQFSDKGQIVARHEGIRQLTIFASRRQAEAAISQLEQLRNNLAHAQDILKADWTTIVQLCEFITRQ
jgi:hypothetical protein